MGRRSGLQQRRELGQNPQEWPGAFGASWGTEGDSGRFTARRCISKQSDRGTERRFAVDNTPLRLVGAEAELEGPDSRETTRHYDSRGRRANWKAQRSPKSKGRTPRPPTARVTGGSQWAQRGRAGATHQHCVQVMRSEASQSRDSSSGARGHPGHLESGGEPKAALQCRPTGKAGGPRQTR